MENNGCFETQGPDLKKIQEESQHDYVKYGKELRLSNMAQLELLNAVIERRVPLRTMVRGFSMQPFICDRDVVTIAPFNGGSLQIGHVVAFTQHNCGRLAIHRIISKKSTGWLIKGDNCSEDDGVYGTGSIIGWVTRIERRDRQIHFGLGRERVLIAFLNHKKGLLILKQLYWLPRRSANFCLCLIQGLSLYRIILRRFAPSVVIALVKESDMEKVSRFLNPSEPYAKRPSNPDVTNIAAWQGRKVIGFVQLVYHPPEHYPWEGYWLFSLNVRSIYRARGIGEKLTTSVIKEALKKGAKELLLLVFEDNNRAISLYQKMGFYQITLPALEPMLVKEKENFTRRRIMMKKNLN
jgi:ribosomal protein S18 acetylase RimI-like enzyme